MPDDLSTEPKPKSSRAPIADLLGAKLRHWDEDAGRTTMDYVAKPEFENGAGVIQGGIITAMLDNAMSMALLKKTAYAFSIPTLELKTSYFRPAVPGPLTGEGWIVHLGKSTAFLEGKLTDGEGKLLASASATVRLMPRSGAPPKGT